MESTSEINQHVTSVMEAMHWPDDAFVPIANEENRKLMDRMQQLMEIRKTKSMHLEQLTERVKLLRIHFENADSDAFQNLVIKI